MGLHTVNKIWKKDEIAALIALYETEQCLYDSKHKHFNDSEKQKEAYERIYQVMLRIRPSCSIGEIKYKLNYLQRQYSGELLHRNISIQAGLCSEESYKSGMWCFGLLQFLDDFLPLKNVTKTVVSEEEQHEETIEKVTSDPQSSNIDHNKEAAGSSSTSIENGVLENPDEERSVKKRRKVDSVSPPRIIVENVPIQSCSVDKEGVFGQYVTSDMKAIQSCSVDREDIFGQYVASEMKALKENPLLYLQTKQSILQILTSANFELINPE